MAKLEILLNAGLTVAAMTECEFIRLEKVLTIRILHGSPGFPNCSSGDADLPLHNGFPPPRVYAIHQVLSAMCRIGTECGMLVAKIGGGGGTDRRIRFKIRVW